MWSLDLPVHLRFDDFDPDCVRVLNGILESTGAQIVCSSDWRNIATLEEMRELYLSRGILRGPVGYTPRMEEFDEAFGLFAWKGWYERMRIVEIREWLRLNPVRHWVAIDDMRLGADWSRRDRGGNLLPFEGGLERFVKTPELEGLKKLNITKHITEAMMYEGSSEDEEGV